MAKKLRRSSTWEKCTRYLAGGELLWRLRVYSRYALSLNFAFDQYLMPAFADVPASSPFCKWIEDLARRGVVTGCGGGNYCPTADVTREQMSVFLAVTFGLALYGL